MEQKARETRELTERLAEQAKTANYELEAFEKTCQHQWGQAVYDPIVHKAYVIPADPPGTMGVDRIPYDTFVSARTVDRWKRECGRCGKEEYTQNVQVQEIKNPDFGGRRW